METTQAQTLGVLQRLDSALNDCIGAVSSSASDSPRIDAKTASRQLFEAARELESIFVQHQLKHGQNELDCVNQDIAMLRAQLEDQDRLLQQQSELLRMWTDRLAVLQTSQRRVIDDRVRDSGSSISE